LQAGSSMRVTVILVMAMCLALTPAFADYLQGLAAWRVGDYEGALSHWQPLADRGDPDALFRIGRMYYQGKGMPRDYQQAARLYEQAAESGHARAQNDLGLMFENGDGVQQDPARAVELYRKAAIAGREVARFNLARMYEQGTGVAADRNEALRWYMKAARSGHAGAQAAVARDFDSGRGSRHPGKAAKWYRKAAQQGSVEAMSRLGFFYDRGLGVKASPEKAIEWYRRAADQGDVAALLNLGSMYAQGTGVFTDRDLASSYFAKAGDVELDPDLLRDQVARDRALPADVPARSVRTELPLVEIVPVEPAPFEGVEVEPVQVEIEPIVSKPPDPAPEDLEHVAASASPADVQSLYEMGRRYSTAPGEIRDDDKAAEYFRQAVDAGSLDAAYDLAFLYLRGRVRLENRKESPRVVAWVLLYRCARAEYGDSEFWKEKVYKEMNKKEKAEARRRVSSL